MNRRKKTEELVGKAILTLLIFIFPVLSEIFTIGRFSISFIMAPIVVGAVIYGTRTAVMMGVVFGLSVTMSGEASMLTEHSYHGTMLMLFAMGIFSGLAAGIVYRKTESFNKWIAVALSSLACPIINMSLFLSGIRVFFMDFIREQAGDKSVTEFLLEDVAGIDFLIDIGLNLFLDIVFVAIAWRIEKIVLTEKPPAERKEK